MEKFVKYSDVTKVYDIDMNDLGAEFAVDGTNVRYIYLKVPASTVIQAGDTVSWDSTFTAKRGLHSDNFYNGVSPVSVNTPAATIKYIYVQNGGDIANGVNGKPASTYAAGDPLMESQGANNEEGMVDVFAIASAGAATIGELKLLNNCMLVATAAKTTTYDLPLQGLGQVVAGAQTTLVGNANAKYLQDLKLNDSIAFTPGGTAYAVSAIATDGLSATIADPGSSKSLGTIYRRFSASVNAVRVPARFIKKA